MIIHMLKRAKTTATEATDYCCVFHTFSLRAVTCDLPRRPAGRGRAYKAQLLVTAALGCGVVHAASPLEIFCEAVAAANSG